MKRFLIAVLMLALAAGTAHAEPYKLTRHGSYIDVETGLSIPADPANRHYRAVLEWIDAGNVPLADVPSAAELAGMIEREADRRILAVTGGETAQRRMLARSNELLLKRITGQAWSPDEQAEVDGMTAVSAWTKDVRATAQDAIDNLSSMTKDEKIAFEPRTDIAWPAAP